MNNYQPKIRTIEEDLGLDSDLFDDDQPQLQDITNPEMDDNALGALGLQQSAQEEQPPYMSIPFRENLANHIDETELRTVGQDLLQAIKNDKNSMQRWLQAYNAALDYLGIEYQGSSLQDILGENQSYSGALLINMIKNSSQIILDFFQQNNITDIDISAPKVDGKKVIEPMLKNQADELNDKINFYLSNVDKGFLPDKYTAANWLVFGGSLFIKTWFDPISNKTLSRYVKPGDLIIDNAMSSLADCRRITHSFTLTEREYRQKVKSGIYRDIPLTSDQSQITNSNIIKDKVSRMEGMNKSNTDASDRDKQYTFYECQTFANFPHLDGSDITVPYKITLSANTGQVVAAYFDWDKSDPLKERNRLYTHLQYMQGFGLLGYGLAQIALNFAMLATSLLRECVTGAQLANRPYVYTTADYEQETSTILPNPGDIIKFKTLTPNASSLFFQPPFKDPSPQILQLLEKAEADISNLSISMTLKIEELQTNAPVGTTLALLMEWHKLPSSMMVRIYKALCDEFSLIYKTMKDNLPSQEDVNQGVAQPTQWGIYTVFADEFHDNFNLLPVVDPNLTSSTLKLLVYDKILLLAQQFPQNHNIYELLKSYYEVLKLPNIDQILVPPEQPQELRSQNPVSENAEAMNGRPIKAEITDDHVSHFIVHKAEFDQMVNNPDLADKAPALHAHMVEHLSMQYMIEIQNQTGQEIIPVDQNQQQVDPTQNEIARKVAEFVSQQQQQQAQQPAPLTPEQVGMAEVEVLKENNQLKHQIELMREEREREQLEVKSRENELKAQVSAYETQANINIKEREIAVKERDLALREQELAFKMHQDVRKIHQEDKRIEYEQLDKDFVPDVKD